MTAENETSPFAEPTGDMSGIDADALMESIESGGNRDVPMSQPAEPAAPQAAAPTPAAEIEFTWNGKQVKAPVSDPRIKQWASQGYDYAQRMAEFNKQQQEFQTRAQQIEELKARYSPVEEYITKNPDWWNHVNSQWEQLQAQQKGLGLDPNNPVAQKLSVYDEKLSKVEQFIQSKQAEEIAHKRQAEDTKLETEIKSIRESYAHLDWNTPNQEGKTLEYQVLEHASAKGINDFRAAFRDFKHDELLKLAEERAKENVVKERQKQTKLGQLGKYQAPAKGLTEARDIKNMSYDDGIREGLKELGIDLQYG